MVSLFVSILAGPAFADVGAEHFIEIGRRHPGSISGFISEVPEEILRKSMLVVKSRSNQPANRYDPRVIMFNSRVTLAYTGYRYRSEDNVEMAEFNPQTKLYDLYSLKFTNGKFSYEKNPFFCQVCHRGSLRPIWPGMMMQPWFAGLLGSGHSDFVVEEKELLGNFIDRHRENPVYKRLISVLRPGEEGLNDLYENNLAFDRQLDHQMTQFTARKLMSDRNFGRIASAFMTVLSMRTNHWIGGKLDVASHLAPLLNEPAETLRSELDLRSKKITDTLKSGHLTKWIDHQYAVESLVKFQSNSFLNHLAKFLAALELVLERGGMDHFRDEAMSVSFREWEIEFLGVNLNPWYYFGKLERELLAQLQVRTGMDFSKQRKMVEEFAEPMIRFSVWESRQSAQESLAKLHSRLCETEMNP